VTIQEEDHRRSQLDSKADGKLRHPPRGKPKRKTTDQAMCEPCLHISNPKRDLLKKGATPWDTGGNGCGEVKGKPRIENQTLSSVQRKGRTRSQKCPEREVATGGGANRRLKESGEDFKGKSRTAPSVRGLSISLEHYGHHSQKDARKDGKVDYVPAVKKEVQREQCDPGRLRPWLRVSEALQ